jgi:hypothetical protein
MTEVQRRMATLSLDALQSGKFKALDEARHR